MGGAGLMGAGAVHQDVDFVADDAVISIEDVTASQSNQRHGLRGSGVAGSPASVGGGPSAASEGAWESRAQVSQLSATVNCYGNVLNAIADDATESHAEARAIRATLAIELSKTEDVADVAEKLVKSNRTLSVAVRALSSTPRMSLGPLPEQSERPGKPQSPDAPWAPMLKVMQGEKVSGSLLMTGGLVLGTF